MAGLKLPPGWNDMHTLPPEDVQEVAILDRVTLRNGSYGYRYQMGYVERWTPDPEMGAFCVMGEYIECAVGWALLPPLPSDS